MRSALYRAIIRCRLRRLAGASRTAPLPAFAALVIVVAAPFALWRAGAAVGGGLAGSDPEEWRTRWCWAPFLRLPWRGS
jgi:hypothetical protein